MAEVEAEEAVATATATDHAWLVDMVIQFMRSPNWNEPIQAFVVENCTKFDNFQEENKHEYIEVHLEFKNLVDSLLTAHLLEVDLDPDEFEKKIQESGLADDPRFQQIVSQLVAAEDFMAFKNMMVDRHQNLQCEAEENFKEITAAEEQSRQAAEAVAAAYEAEAIAAAADAAAAGSGVPAPAGGPAGVVPAPAKAPAATSNAPTAAEERAFGAGGGSYGRAQMAAGGKKAGGTEKAAAIRNAILGAARK